MLPDQIVLEVLKEKPEFKEEEKIVEIIEKAKKEGKKIEDYVIDENIFDIDSLYNEAAGKMEVHVVSLKNLEIKKEVLDLIPVKLAETQNIIAFDCNEQEISLAMLDPEDIQTIEFIRRKTGLEPKIFLTTPSEMKDALRNYHLDLERDISVIQGKKENLSGGDLKKVAEDLPVIKIVYTTLEHAIYEGASDIHIEPTETELVVRFRIDGELNEVMTLPNNLKSGVVARIKVLANLKLDEHMAPQDGRFKIQINNEKYSFRVSIIPVYDGEKIVLRLLNEGQKPLTLDQLGFLPDAKKIVESALEKPHGTILVTGPTGSGKTTTLYSMLGILNQPGVNISTIEDPIEYHVKGVNQSQVNTRVGFTFASGLRAFLRQDPDIIMVGEIRDQETAEIAIHAAMTGHLVLSTLHTNDAPTTIPRLIDMGVPPFLVSFTLNVIIAQRLVRKICANCKKEYKLTPAAIEELQTQFDTKQLSALFKKQKIKLSEKEKNLESMVFYQGAGCVKCKKTGYKGRVGIYEVLEMNKEMAKKINEKATAEEIKFYAYSQGMISMMQDGLIKAKIGITTLEEVLRATRD